MALVVDPNDPPADDEGKPFPEDAYWRVVRATVRRVFGGGDEAAKKAADVERKVRTTGLGGRNRFYQTDPYNVASDIVGETGAGTERQWREYLDIKREYDFGDVEVPDDLHSPFRRL